MVAATLTELRKEVPAHLPRFLGSTLHLIGLDDEGGDRFCARAFSRQHGLPAVPDRYRGGERSVVA